MKYEYQYIVDYVEIGPFVDKLNEMSGEGWRAVSINAENRPYPHPVRYSAIVEREVVVHGPQ